MSFTSDNSLQAIRKYFPGAVNIDFLFDKIYEIIKKELDINPEQIIHADSICSDDVNNIEYPEHARLMLGPFNLGGLGGFPFTGITGITAFAHHVPEDGAVLVYFGPHIGVSKTGQLGKLLRVGQQNHSTCCGAAIAALDKLINNKIIPNEITELDYQQNIMEQIFLKHGKKIISAENPILESTNVLYGAIHKRIHELISKTDYTCKNIILTGGILINSDFDTRSYFECRDFEIVDSGTFRAKNLLAKINRK